MSLNTCNLPSWTLGLTCCSSVSAQLGRVPTLPRYTHVMSYLRAVCPPCPGVCSFRGFGSALFGRTSGCLLFVLSMSKPGCRAAAFINFERLHCFFKVFFFIFLASPTDQYQSMLCTIFISSPQASCLSVSLSGLKTFCWLTLQVLQ